MARPPRWLNLKANRHGATAAPRHQDLEKCTALPHQGQETVIRVLRPWRWRELAQNARRGPYDPRAFSPRAASLANEALLSCRSGPETRISV